jgi:hypothetical protein
MATLSVRAIAEQHLDKTGDLSINSDVYGYIYRGDDGTMCGPLKSHDVLPGSGTAAQPTTRSLRRHLETLSAASVDLVMILVGHEPDFSGAVDRDDVTKTQYGLPVAGDLYAQVDFGIRKIVWWRIPMANVNGYVKLDGESKAEDLTHDHSGPPGGIDVFLVQTIDGNGGLGPARPPGPFNKDRNLQLTGVLVALSSDRQWAGQTIAHEFGHYLGLDHTTTITNLMCGDLDGDGIGDMTYISTGVTASQAARMKSNAAGKLTSMNNSRGKPRCHL